MKSHEDKIIFICIQYLDKSGTKIDPRREKEERPSKKKTKQTNKQKQKQKTHEQKTNMELASNLLHVHVTPKIRPNMPLCHI